MDQRVNSFITQLEYDDLADEFILVLPEGFLNALGWKLNDELSIEVIDGKILIKKAENES